MGTLGIFQIKKSIFLKVADIVRKIDIWPENDILGVLEWFGSLIWYLESSRTNFEKIEKNRIFWIFDLWVTTMSGSKFRPIGRKSAKKCCWSLQTPLNSFQKKISTFVRTHSGGILKFVFLVLGLKIAYFGKVLRLLLLLRFWVPRCCFLKSSKSGLSEKYMVYGVISSR